MKVLQICAAYKPAYIYGGPTISMSALCEQLIQNNIEIQVFSTTANGQNELNVNPGQKIKVYGVEVTYFKRLTKDHTHFSPSLLKATWNEAKNFDIIHIHTWWNLVSLFTAFIALIKGVPVVVSTRGTLSPYSFQNKNIGPKWFIHHLFGKYLLKYSSIHVTSERERKSIINLLIPNKIFLIPNLIKLPTNNTLINKLNKSVFKLLFFSRIEQKKGLDLLIKALPMITIPYQLTIAGSGNLDYVESLKLLAVNYQVEKNISWVGFKQEDKFEALSEHDLFILPSYDENFGNSVIESLSVGTAVLVSNNVGLASYVEANKLGFVCITSPDSIACSINNIVNNKRDELIYIKENAPRIIFNDFNVNSLIKKYLSMYDEIL